MTDEITKNPGTLTALAGTWEDDEGIDISRIHSRETETRYREKTKFESHGLQVADS